MRTRAPSMGLSNPAQPKALSAIGGEISHAYPSFQSVLDEDLPHKSFFVCAVCAMSSVSVLTVLSAFMLAQPSVFPFFFFPTKKPTYHLKCIVWTWEGKVLET